MRHGFLLVLLFALIHQSGASQRDTTITGSGWEERFSEGLDAWTFQRLDRRSTQFNIVLEQGNPVLRGLADRSAAALWSDASAAGYADVLSWRWKITASLIANRDEQERGGDDYTARVFAIFGDEIFTSDTQALLYVWSGNEPAGSIYRSPYASEVVTIVLQQGNQRAGQWVEEDRHLGDDYRAAFGEEPPPLRAVAVMVDTDNTDAWAEAWFDDFVLRRAEGR